jgi:hypothetical protein
VDYQSRPGVPPKKRRRDRLIQWATTHADWVLGFLDETWWSRLARPAVHTWTTSEQPLRLVEQPVATLDPDPKALACYGLLRTDVQEVWLRFVDGRPVSVVTTQFLAWCCDRLAADDKAALLLVWDNASWHVSRAVRTWVRAHNQQVRAIGVGVRIVTCPLPIKSPWLNPIEPHWVHGKRAVVAPDHLLSAQELADRVCAYFACPHHEHLVIPQEVA